MRYILSGSSKSCDVGADSATLLRSTGDRISARVNEYVESGRTPCGVRDPTGQTFTNLL